MKNHFMHHHRANRQSNRGVVLVISLILLVVMTLFGLTAVKLVSSEERMVGNTFDRTLAFQAAEAQLRLAERQIEDVKQPSPAALVACALAGTPATLMTCGAPAATATPRWLDTSFASWTAGTAVGSGNLAITPDYFVEYLGNTYSCGFDPVASAKTCKRYRVTVRAAPGTGRAAVVLQSIYATS
jgi:type IV pilus assembly protein PilX